ncbi:MAG: hypothetical protein K6G81_04520 [Lachnospiraceae bacterium]|nr:hypothetical protein [Lachnospiraceae bacterium]
MAKKSLEENVKKNTKKGFKKKIAKLTAFVLAVTAAAAAIAKLIDIILEKKRQVKNVDSDIKEYSGIFASQNVTLREFGVAGIISKANFSAINLDLSEATFKQDAFITLTANMSAINITIPKGYTVSFDGLLNKCAVRNEFEQEEKKEPVIYIAAKANCCAIRINKG